MNVMPKDSHVVALEIAVVWQRLERQLTSALSQVRGISFAEFRILNALAEEDGARLTRVDLAARVGLTPSGITRALKPLEKLGMVETVRSERDSRLALAHLTRAGRNVVSDGRDAVDVVIEGLTARSSKRAPSVGAVLEVLARSGPA